VDIFVLASLYTLRVFAGAFASRVEISPWLIVFCLFFFLGLAAAKRYVELDTVTHSAGSAHSRRGYIASDKSLISTLGLASGMVSVLVLALYIQAPEVVRFYRHPWGLWVICPLVLLWISRVWFLAHRQILHEDPVVFALHDRASLVVGLLTAIAVCLAT
jgi:4-hydroxybenzoate polyprenyltransferase